MKTTSLLLFLCISSLAFAKYQYVSPMPGSTMISPEHNIIIRHGEILDASSVNKDVFIIHGSKSGDHTFRCVISRDQKTIVLYPDQPFGFDENVTVTVNAGLRTNNAGNIESYSFSFSTHREYSPEEKTYFKKMNTLSMEMEQPVNEQSANEPLKEPGDNEREISGSFTIITNTNPAPGDVFYDAWNGNFFGSTKFDGYNIITNDGDSVFASDKISTCFDFSINPDGYLSVYNSDKGGFDILDSNYTVIDTYYPGNGYSSDPHEFTRYANGNAFLVAEETHTVNMTQYGGSANATVMTTIIQEFDPDKNVIFEWRAWDHITIPESNQNLAFSYVDLVHTNSIELDVDGNIIESNRHLDQVNKIDINTGDFIWRLGGVMNQFTFIGDDERFKYQHDARRLANGNITVFDDGNTHVPAHSAAKEYQLDFDNMTATLVWKFQPLTYSGTNAYFYAMGSAQRLSNGNTLVCGGWDNSSNQSNIWEVTPDGEVVWEMALDNSKSLVGYRALKYTWIPCAPVNPNSVKAKNVTNTTAKIQWKAVSNAVSYDVQYRKQGSTNWLLKTSLTPAKNLKNLQPNKTYQYQVRAHCANGFAADWSPIKTFTTLPQRLLDDEDIVSFQLHPNPTDGALTIDLNLKQDQPVTFSVYDLSGKLVFTSTQQLSAGDQSLNFDMSALTSAVYLAEVKTQSGNQTIKFVKE